MIEALLSYNQEVCFLSQWSLKWEILINKAGFYIWLRQKAKLLLLTDNLIALKIQNDFKGTINS